MSEESEHFSNAPTIEAIFEISAPARLSGNQDDFNKAAREKLDAETFPTMNSLIHSNLRVSNHPETGEPVAEGKSDWQGVDFRSQDGKLAIQFRRDGMSLHRLAPYTSYEEILPTFKDMWARFFQLAEPKATTRQSLRFVNRIALPKDVSLDRVGEFAKIVPAFALEDQLEPENLLSRVQLKERATGHRAYVSFSLVDPAASPLQLIFDIHTACERGFGPADSDIWEHFAQLRTLKNQIFIGSLQDRCINSFR